MTAFKAGDTVELNGVKMDEQYPAVANKGDIGVVLSLDTDDIGIIDFPFYTVEFADVKHPYSDGFWGEELELITA